MPQFSLLYVLFATVAKVRIFPETTKYFCDNFSIFFRWLAAGGQVTHLPTYPPMTRTFPENVDY
jgi:hypothetical protein